MGLAAAHAQPAGPPPVQPMQPRGLLGNGTRGLLGPLGYGKP
jgi:hypothetical protein